MKFEELSKEHQGFLIYSNEFDEEYEIIDDLAESKACNMFSIIFCHGKVKLEVEDAYEDYY